MKCKWCGAEVELGKRCEYCGSIAEPFYYGVNPEKKEQHRKKRNTQCKRVTIFGKLHGDFTEKAPPAMRWHVETALRTRI